MIRAAALGLLAAMSLSVQVVRAAPADIPDCNASGITPPRPANKHAMEPGDYPVLSVALGEEGTTILLLAVQPDGSVGESKVSKTSGSLRLDEAAASVAQQRWRYTPPQRDGKAIACRYLVAVTWKLHDEEFGNGAGFVLQTTDKDFPPGALAKGERGATGLFISTSETQTPDVVVARSSGFADLDAAAAALALKRVKLPHGEVDGKPLKTFTILIVLWSPGGAAPK